MKNLKQKLMGGALVLTILTTTTSSFAQTGKDVEVAKGQYYKPVPSIATLSYDFASGNINPGLADDAEDGNIIKADPITEKDVPTTDPDPAVKPEPVKPGYVNDNDQKEDPVAPDKVNTEEVKPGYVNDNDQKEDGNADDQVKQDADKKEADKKDAEKDAEKVIKDEVDKEKGVNDEKTEAAKDDKTADEKNEDKQSETKEEAKPDSDKEDEKNDEKDEDAEAEVVKPSKEMSNAKQGVDPSMHFIRQNYTYSDDKNIINMLGTDIKLYQDLDATKAELQKRSDRRLNEFVNWGRTDLNTKVHGDGQSAYLLTHRDVYGKDLLDAKSLLFADSKGQVKEYELKEVKVFPYSEYMNNYQLRVEQNLEEEGIYIHTCESGAENSDFVIYVYK